MQRFLAAAVTAPLLSLGLGVLPAIAADDVNIVTTGDAVVTNTAFANASSGDNRALGGFGGNGGNAGDVNAGEDGEENHSGNGGMGGHGGMGGGVIAGDARAVVELHNLLNALRVEVGGDTDTGSEVDDVNVTNTGAASITNDGGATAASGGNAVNGNTGGNGGNGGMVNGSDEGSSSGTGGDGGMGGDGGVIQSGMADVRTHIMNRLNVTMVRVRR